MRLLPTSLARHSCEASFSKRSNVREQVQQAQYWMSSPGELAAAAAMFRRLHPRAYLARLIEQGVRADGRKPMEPRPVKLVQGTITTTDGVRVCLQLTLCLWRIVRI